jgi:hypothetical protein
MRQHCINAWPAVVVGLLVACTESTRGLDVGPTPDAATDADALAEGEQDATTTAQDAATATDGATEADATASVGFPVDVACVPSDELVFEACPSAQRPASSVRTEIDLRDQAAGATGRCDAADRGRFQFFDAYELPGDPAAYPPVVRVSSRGFVGPCTFCNVDDSTTYGVGFRVRRCEQTDARGGCTDGGLDSRLGLRVAVRVTPAHAWTVGAGGCGKACPYPCAGGYQEVPRSSCLPPKYDAFGVTTTATDAPDAEIYVDLVPAALAFDCCPYACPA